MEVDEDGADELAVLECGVSGHVGIVNGEFNDLRCLASSDTNERVDHETSIVAWLDMRGLGRVQRGAVDYRAVERDGLNLPPKTVMIGLEG